MIYSDRTFHIIPLFRFHFVHEQESKLFKTKTPQIACFSLTEFYFQQVCNVKSEPNETEFYQATDSNGKYIFRMVT